MSKWLLIFEGILFLALALLFYIFVFLFIPRKYEPRKMVEKIIVWVKSPTAVLKFWRTILTIGYMKRAIKKFYQYYRLKFSPQPRAEEGKSCPNATVVNLDGEMKSLLHDFVQVDPHIPLILNMGSYT
jgi:predicted metal-dependent hydrolase